MTAEELRAAGIPLSGDDAAAVLNAEAALDWLQQNTTLEIDREDTQSIAALPASVKLFIVKFMEVSTRAAGVTSQSIEGLSMTFSADSNGGGAMIWQYASMYLRPWLKSQVSVTPAKRRW